MAHFISPLCRYHRSCRSGLLLDVHLGLPLSDGSSVLRVSRFGVRGPAVDRHEYAPTLPGFLRLDAVTRRLLLHFESTMLSPGMRQSYFAEGYLRVNTAFPLPSAVVRSLGLATGGHLIVAGQYPVLDDGTFLTTSFRLAREQALRRPAA